MGRFTEKQLLIATVAVSFLVIVGFGVLIYLDWNAIYGAEITDANPEAAEISDPEQWGEKRRIQELEKEMDAARKEAELIPRREQDVIVYREIVNRDAAILPNFDDVNNLVKTIGEFERLSGVSLIEVAKLNLSKDAKGKAIRTMPVNLKLSGTFDQVLKFINLFENLDRMVNTSGFAITAGNSPEASEDVIHDCKLDLVTFIYTSNAGLAKPVNIANYDRRKDDPVIQKLIRQQKPAHVAKYQLKHRVNRRDPLVDPRRPAADPSDDGSGAADYDTQKAIVDELAFEVELLKEDLRQEEVYKQEKKYVQWAQIKKLIDEKVGILAGNIESATPEITIPELVEIFQNEVVTPFEQVKKGRDIDDRPPLVSMREVTDFHNEMTAAFEGTEYENVKNLWQDFSARIKNTEVVEEALPLVDEMRGMVEDAEVMIEFQKLEINVSGLILMKPIERSSALINGRSFRKGDYVDSGQRCRLDGIEKERLIFNFNGRRIEMPLEGK